MATLEDKYGEQARLLECLNQKKDKDLKQVKQSLAETMVEKADMQDQIEKFALELQDQKVS